MSRKRPRACVRMRARASKKGTDGILYIDIYIYIYIVYRYIYIYIYREGRLLVSIFCRRIKLCFSSSVLGILVCFSGCLIFGFHGSCSSCNFFFRDVGGRCFLWGLVRGTPLWRRYNIERQRVVCPSHTFKRGCKIASSKYSRVSDRCWPLLSMQLIQSTSTRDAIRTNGTEGSRVTCVSEEEKFQTAFLSISLSRVRACALSRSPSFTHAREVRSFAELLVQFCSCVT